MSAECLEQEKLLEFAYKGRMQEALTYTRYENTIKGILLSMKSHYTVSIGFVLFGMLKTKFNFRNELGKYMLIMYYADGDAFVQVPLKTDAQSEVLYARK